MTNKIITAVAAGTLFATALAPAAFAQNAPAGQAPATQTPAAPATTNMTPSAGASTTAGMEGGYLTQQAPDQVSANTYIGQSVYNGQNESIGKINDLIMKKDGGIVAAVIGVGGFLGIGEKNVAVPIQKVNVAQNTQDGSVKLTTQETADALKSAPEFKTLQMQSAEKAPANSTDATSTGSTTNK